MALHIQQSLSGFIVSEPQRSATENGDTRFYVSIGQPHFRREDNGDFTVLEPSFHDLVTYRAPPSGPSPDSPGATASSPRAT